MAMATQWIQCKKCGAVGSYKYVPYSLGNPTVIFNCECGHKVLNDEFERRKVNFITAKEARMIKTAVAGKA